VAKLNNPASNTIYEFKAIPDYEKFYSNDSAYGVYQFKTYTDLPHARKSNRTYDLMSETLGEDYSNVSTSIMVGKMPRLSIGQEYKIKAKLIYSSKYKQNQYEVISVEQDVPKTVNDQKKFLSSILTENQVNVLLEAYPNVIDMVMSGEGDQIDLNKTKGIKDYTWNIIKNKIEENFVNADILSLLAPLGISLNKIKKLLDDEPNAHILRQRILNDPYLVADVPGLNFKVADKVALKLNPDLLISDKRVVSFLKTYLKDLGESEGHTWVTRDELELAVKENIIECLDVFQCLLEQEKENSRILHIENDKIGLKYFYDAEKRIYDIIIKISNSVPLVISEEDILSSIEKSETDQGFIYSEEQRNAIINITKNNFSTLGGIAGSGKSSVSRAILNIYSKYNIACVALAAKAAKRLNETTGYNATTIHRLLGAIGYNKFSYDEYNPLPHDLILIDESSMINAFLILSLMKALKPGCKVIMVGDFRQLPPIGVANIFSDLLDKEELQVNSLTQIHRQAARSGIIADSNLIRNGINPVPEKSFKLVHGELEDLFYMFRSSREELNDIAIKTFLKSIESDGLDNVIILTPRKQDCTNSTREINKKIQDILIPDTVPSMEYGKIKYKVGAKIINIQNDYEKMVMNGEMGYVSRFDKNEDGEDVLIAEIEGKEIEYLRTELNKIDLAYALSTHKFQGSQCNTVISIVDNTHFILLSREYLYTTITRSIKRCLVLAEPWAFDTAIETSKSTVRNTWLKNM
jgi:exodeoxyribonuclease V alpha subunit